MASIYTYNKRIVKSLLQSANPDFVTVNNCTLCQYISHGTLKRALLFIRRKCDANYAAQRYGTTSSRTRTV